MSGGCTAAQACKLTFSSYRLQPLGSYPRIVDKKGSHDLFGPVNKIYCASYDRAMALYLACLRVSWSPVSHLSFIPRPPCPAASWAPLLLSVPLSY